MELRLYKEKRGFTLIELLVVIAIIGILSSVVLASLNSARKKTREARRVADLKQLQLALELYADDHNGYYPQTSGWITGGCAVTDYIPDIKPMYIPLLPHDPTCGSSNCTGGTGKDYIYQSNGTDYKLLDDGCFETDTYTGDGKAFDDPVRNWTFGAVYTPRAKNW